MKKLIPFLLLAAALSGCVSVDHTTVIDTNQEGYATGQYRDVRSGKICDLAVWGLGGGGASSAASAAFAIPLALTSAANSHSGGGGGGAAGFRISPPPTQGNPMPFAKAVATINYSRRLANIRYDEQGDVVEYKFSDGPLKQGYQPFGRQPVQ